MLEPTSGQGGPGGGGGSGSAPGAPDAGVDLLAQFSGCLTFANFEAANFGQAWDRTTATDGSQCIACHGASNGMFPPVDADFFHVLTTSRSEIELFFRVSGGKVVVGLDTFTTVGSQQAPHAEHPAFNLANSGGPTATQKLYDSAEALLGAGQCGPPTLGN